MKMVARGGAPARTVDRGPDLVDDAGHVHARELWRLAHLEVYRALRELGSNPSGLSDHEASARLTRYGLNTLPTERVPTWGRRLWVGLCNPFVLLLIALDAAVAVTRDVAAVSLITVMVVMSLALRVYNEQRFDHLAAALGDLTGTRVAVLRRLGRGGRSTTPRHRNPRLLVPGDLIRLEAGDVIPADCRVVEAEAFAVDQALFTGESTPVAKTAEPRPATAVRGRATIDDLLATPTVCLAGTGVAAGQAVAVVAKTGVATILAATARNVAAPRRASSADLGLSRVTWLNIQLLAVLVPAVFVITALVNRHGHWTSAALFAVAVAVGLVPQMLPVLLTVAHGRGLSALARCGVAVTRPAAVQDLGGMDVLCLDKTGTLTSGAPVLTDWLDADGRTAPEVLEYAQLAGVFTADPRNSLDAAIQAVVTPLDRELAETRYDKLGNITFDPDRRCSGVLLGRTDGPVLAVIKGAVAEILARCDRIRRDGRDRDLTAAGRARVEVVCRRHWRTGRRILAIAYAEGPAALDASGPLTLVGLLMFTDPPRPGTAEAVDRLAARGIRTVVLTGDATELGVAVCASLNIATTGQPATGHDVDRLDDRELAALVATATVFTQVGPLHKARIVAAFRRRGHIVGYLGDGINDTPALRAADVGLCVAGAVGVARQAADAVLLDKDLGVLDRAVAEGRTATLNATKYLKATLSANLGNVLSVLAAAAFLPFLPMLPVQLLVQNLCYDLTQLALPFDRAEPGQIRGPLRWSYRDLAGFVTRFALLGSVFDLATFWLLRRELDEYTAGGQVLFHTGWFVQGLLTQTLAVCVIRTIAVPVLRGRPTWPLALTTIAGCAAALFVPVIPAASRLGFDSLPADVLLGIGVLTVAYLAALQLAKQAYRRLTGRWL
jgi:Mg2+-importing ATPase